MVVVMPGTTQMTKMARRTSPITFSGDYNDGDDDGAMNILMMTSTPMTMRGRSLMCLVLLARSESWTHEQYSYAFPKVFLGIPIISMWYSHWFPTVFLGVPMVFLWFAKDPEAHHD